MAEPTEVYTSTHVLEYPYSRSVGPVIGAFLTGLREGKIVGIRGENGRVIVPPTEYDPETGAETSGFVDVGPGGVIETWAWVEHPRDDAPRSTPFAWALVRLDGADTALLHVVDAASKDEVTTGARVTAHFLDEGERQGRIQDLCCFQLEETS
ncbi:unannotated protein [freshwater metagenome]|uniref:Unannotated protein n=1 Tax=freshwater metagenome TaxID=449393 RepID=A0A6J7QWI3_9ZZZZ